MKVELSRDIIKFIVRHSSLLDCKDNLTDGYARMVFKSILDSCVNTVCRFLGLFF